MKKFAGNKSLKQIRAQCASQGLKLHDSLYKGGADFITVEGGGGHAIYNTFNGRFFGTTDTGVEFSSDETTHEDQPWFQALLAFFYIEKPAQASTSPSN